MKEKESLVGKIKFYNNREVVVLREEGEGFVFVCANLNPTHEVTGSNWCTMCMAGGDFIASHTCEMAQEVIDNLMDNIEDHEVFWVHESYLNDHPFEYKAYQKLVDEITKLKDKKIDVENSIEDLEHQNNCLLANKTVYEDELVDLQLKIQDAQHELMLIQEEESHKTPQLPQTIQTGDVRLSLKELLDLYESRLILQALENGEVDNWEYYEESLDGSDFESEAINEVARILKDK